MKRITEMVEELNDGVEMGTFQMNGEYYDDLSEIIHSLKDEDENITVRELLERSLREQGQEKYIKGNDWRE